MAKFAAHINGNTPQHRISCRRMLVVAALLVISMLMLGGCRYSDVLTERIEDMSSTNLDEQAEPYYQQDPNAEERPDLISAIESQNDNLADQENILPDYSDDENTTEAEADQRENDAESDNDQDATEGNDVSQDGEKDDETPNSESDRSKDDDSTADGSGSDETNDESEDASGVPESGDSPEQDSSTGDQGAGGKEGTVFDGSKYEDIPEDIKGIAATGHYATITQMLAGKGGLLAADATWIANMQAKGAFPDEGLDKIVAGWSGNGTAADSVNVQAIIDSGADALLTDGTSTALSKTATDALTKAGVNIVVMPAIGTADTPDENIITAVKVVGELLKSAEAPTQYDTAKMAQLYIDLHDSALENCKAANGGYSYKVIGGAGTPMIYQGNKGDGTATTEISGQRQYTAIIDSVVAAKSSSITAKRAFGTTELYLNEKEVNLKDGVGLSATCSSDDFLLADYYLQTAGVVNNAYDVPKPGAATGEMSLPYVIVAGGSDGLVSVNANARFAPSALWLDKSNYSTSDVWTCVGDADFPAVMVRDEKIAEKIEKSAARKNGLYNVGQPYQIFIVPSGVSGSWCDGTPESYLLAPWTFCMFWQTQELDACTSYVDDFYSAFYRMKSGSKSLDGYGTARRAECPTS